MIINNLIIENISNANEEYLNAFYKVLSDINPKLVSIINAHNTKIILADKLSDVLNRAKCNIEKYQDYHPKNRDELTHGLCSDTLNALCIFSNTTKIPHIGAFLYHEIGHLLDVFKDWKKESVKGYLSNKNEFVTAYKNDISKHWYKIKNDNRFRLKHYIQSSTPDKISTAGLSETFAFCFARNNGKQEDIDIISEYFQETLLAAKKIENEYIMGFKL